MFLAEPQPTQGDLNFQIFGIPVRVHPFFWLIAFLLGMSDPDPVSVLIWVAAVFVSIVVHELGHAFAARAHGWPPRITLYSFGGLATYSPTYHTPRSQILISAAGPAAGFALAAAVILAVRLAGHKIGFFGGGSPDFEALGVDSLLPVRLVAFDVYFTPFAARQMNLLVHDLLQINVLWGLVNLLPVYPLDGGHIARELLLVANARTGIKQSLWLSVATAAGLAVYAVAQGELFITLMFGMLAYESYKTLRAYGGMGGGGRW
jgi:stage IV sporulation protein FB